MWLFSRQLPEADLSPPGIPRGVFHLQLRRAGERGYLPVVVPGPLPEASADGTGPPGHTLRQQGSE